MISKSVTNIVNRTEIYRLEETCSRLISLCNSKSFKEGICIHSPIIKLSLQDKLFLNNNLLSLYVKCSRVENARHFFDEMPLKDVASWTGILSGYVKNKKHYEALDLFYCMMISGQYPNEFTFSSVLRSCSALGEFNYGTRVQSYVIKYGFQSNPFSGSALIDLYSKWGFTNEAYKLFTCMENGDTVSWTTMISSFVKERKWSRALQFYVHMIEAGVHPNEFTFVKILAASCFLGLSYGRLVHGHMIVRGVKMNVVLKTALVDMYSRCQRMEDAIKVSNLTPEYDVLLWTTIISGFTQNLKFREAVAAFHDMEVCGVAPNNFTYSSILGACSSVLSLDLGRQIHSRVIMAGLEDDVSVGNALVDMYLKCSSMIESGLRAFRVISSPNVISWTSLIAGFVEHGFHQEAFQLFEEMQASGVQPNSFTISSILGACSTVESVSQLSKIHGCAIKTEVDDDIVVGNALVDAYAGLGLVDDAWQVISKMSHRDAAAYTSLATRMNQMGHHEAALNIITHMYNDNVKMDGFSLASFIAASASLAGEEIGKQLHCHSMKSGLVCWISVSNSLVDLYGKSGSLSDAHRVFREITEPDVVSWNTLISGLASNGYISFALSAFDDMRLAGIKPDYVTYLIVLSACSRGGLVDLGLEYFQSMEKVHYLLPQFDHYVRLVDLLGRAGRLEEAMDVLQTMPFRPDALIYKTLLGACKMHKNVPLGEDIARRGLELDPSDPAFYVLLADLYNNTGHSDLAENTFQMMRERGLMNPEPSSMEYGNKIHLFIAGHAEDGVHEENRLSYNRV
ncbi:pentatricopeptide repeat-containing protein At5g52850, chloroplastic [Pistacia vera]|uniref:pentatricopeptide repeat-containing protein At5g52850, chloroplastic-like n=1 Tax=Pistacia vera TaxID=55513 RepID=UPI00126354DB|nr:pentatricopeptide repeat-containing protein At5g52850, chloroplastic-like [Pistacia vera]XP_031261516.1 pentatricopeptide repeat-containing protein At5g52850, chloroplastic-like [Pistacia vera]XP_031269533.1 pentatricopeptide repeat-containing protein At5g52850, chloroplastic [Pistacia vera]